MQPALDTLSPDSLDSLTEMPHHVAVHTHDHQPDDRGGMSGMWRNSGLYQDYINHFKDLSGLGQEIASNGRNFWITSRNQETVSVIFPRHLNLKYSVMTY